jgi:FMN-dependent NADH-azoreductase
MSKLLYIEAAPLKSRSHTIAVSDAFLDAYRVAHPDDEIERLDLWQTALPPFDAQTIEAKFAVLRHNEFTNQQFERWDAVRRVSRHFNAADQYVFSVPMWNFGVPYVLKHYIDVVTLPGENWSWSRHSGYGTLLAGKKALAIYASANLHEDDDFQKPFMRRWLRFIGIEDVHEITVAPTLSDPETVARLRAEAIGIATQLAAEY